MKADDFVTILERKEKGRAVIQIEAIRIIELRGIRELEIKPKRKSFVISGGNGSGKSGVVDAIEFALTGGISRLADKGTVGLTVLRHGPHVDRRDDPSVAEVASRVGSRPARPGKSRYGVCH